MRTLKRLNKADIKALRIELTHNDILFPDEIRVKYNEVYGLWQMIFIKDNKVIFASIRYSDVDAESIEKQLRLEFMSPMPKQHSKVTVKFLPAFPHRRLGKKDAEKLTKVVSKVKRKTDAK